MDKSRCTKINDKKKVNKENISNPISSFSLSEKVLQLKKSEKDTINENLSIYDFSGHRKSLSSVTPDQKHIPCKNKRKKTSDTLIIKKETIQGPVSPSQGWKKIL